MVSPATTAAVPRVPIVVRQRLLDRLAARFETRLTTVIGGGGSGKTTAIAQAIADEPVNVDVWYPATRADRDDARLVSGLLAACRQAVAMDDAGDSDAIDAIVDLVLACSPRRVCLVVDDAHVLGSSQILDELLERLPANGHLLLAGRRLPTINTARLDAAGQLAEISQDELLMTAEEQRDFANLRGVDVAQLVGAEGWPAFIELAVTGTDARSRRYLEQEAVDALGAERRGLLAVFAHVGGGDDEIARAVAGCPLDELIEGLPLVRWSGGAAQLHDLWSDLVATDADDEMRADAAIAAAGVHRERGDFDEAIELLATALAWNELIDTLADVARRSVDGGLRPDDLARWRAHVPGELDDHPTVTLIDGLIARERDQTSVHAADLLDRAARGFADAGQADLELVALAQAGYLARITGEVDAVEPVMARIAALAERHPPARPFLAFGEAWKALAVGRPDLELAAMEAITDAELPTVWRLTRDHLIANAFCGLGRPGEAIERVPANLGASPVPIPGALMTEAQAYWFAGRPDEAFAAVPKNLSPRHGARDRYIAGVWVGLMSAMAGRVHEAHESLRLADSSVGENPPVYIAAQLWSVKIVLQLVEGDEDRARADFESVLELFPLGNGGSERYLRGHLAFTYVITPTTREFWDAEQLNPSFHRAREVARAFVAARERGDFGRLETMVWPDPGEVAVALTVRWAIEFALFGVVAGRQEGWQLATWLCEHWGEPARQALRSWVGDDQLGSVAREVVARTPSPPTQIVSLRLLGPTDLLLDGRSTADADWRRERVRALITWLALNPTSTRDQVAGALWPDLTIEKAAKNLRTTLNYVHSVLEPRRSKGDAPWFVRVNGAQISLHPDLDVDLWRFDAVLDEAERAEREGRPSDALPLLIDAVAMWAGDVAADLEYDWLDLQRIHTRSRFVRAACRAGELLVATGRAGEAIEVIRPALAADPWHDRSYDALAEAYQALGDRTSARAVLQRAETQLGDFP